MVGLPEGLSAKEYYNLSICSLAGDKEAEKQLRELGQNKFQIEHAGRIGINKRSQWMFGESLPREELNKLSL